ncbi:MAG: EAL domain-containing protein [Terracidiphilus sp.]
MAKQATSGRTTLKLSRALKVLGDCTSTLVNAESEQQIFEDICRIVVSSGAYRMAWVGVAEMDAGKRVRPIAQSGFEDGYLETITITWDESSLGYGPTGTAVRTGQAQVNQNVLVNPKMTPWRADAVKRGYQSSIALPFIADGGMRWVLTVYAAEIDAFEPGETKLLQNLVDNLSFGIAALHTRIERERAMKELEFKNTVLLTQQETSLDGILVVDEHAKIVSFNRRFIELWNIPECLANAGDDVAVLEVVARRTAKADAFLGKVRDLYTSKEATSHDEIELIDGRVIDRYSAPVVSRDGSYSGRIWYFRDITERKQSENRIARLARIHTVLSGINSAIVRIADRGVLFREVCRTAVEQGGFGMAWIGMIEPRRTQIVPMACAGLETEPFLVLVPMDGDSPHGTDEILCAIREQRAVFNNDFASGAVTGSEFRKRAIRRGYGSAIALPLVVNGTTVGVFVLCGYDANFFDDTELQLMNEIAGDISFALNHIEKQEQVNILAYYDALTGLPNRALFAERLSERLRLSKHSERKFAVAVLDIERFRYLNGMFSRSFGDALLKQVADLLAEACGEDRTVARIGADIFAFILDQIEEIDVAQFISQNIVGCFARPFHIDGQDLRISVRLGISVFPRDGISAEALYKNAESAVFRAKEAKEQAVFYSHEMNARAAEAMELETRLRKAIAEEQFVLYYQPVIDSVTGAVAGLEALIRWQDPERGLILPGEFIPILEETGLILQVGDWTIQKALADYQRWRSQGLNPPRIAVNVSAVQLRRKDFVSSLENAIGILASPDHGLNLEITESVIMTNVEENIEKLNAVKKMKIGIAIDDFGTGYSSLQYLARLPVDSLKIDRSFVSRIADFPNDMAIVATIIALAHTLHLDVIGEGIEVEKQADLLRRLNCDMMQGFLFAKPSPPSRIETLLEGQLISSGRRG